MTKPERRELIDLLIEMSEIYPDWRFGQLIINLANMANAETWDAEDTQLIEAARSHLQQRGAGPAGSKDAAA
jgi:hypothetical protein